MYTITDNNTSIVLSLSDAKKHLKIEQSFTEEDSLIDDAIAAAVNFAENYIGGHIKEKQLVLKLPSFSNVIFEAFPFKSIDSISYLDGLNVSNILPTDNYKLKMVNEKTYELIFQGDLPLVKENDSEVITVAATIGFETIPKAIVQAIKLIIADFHERREDRQDINHTRAMLLLKPYRKY